MEPSIHTGSTVFIKKALSYAEGDVITFKNKKSGVVTTHRIVEVKKTGSNISFITKGDANNSTDLGGVTKGEVIGKVHFSVPYLGYVVGMTREPLGAIMFILIPAVVLILGEMRKIISEIKILRSRKQADTKELSKPKPICVPKEPQWVNMSPYVLDLRKL